MMLLETTGIDIAKYIVIVFQVVVCILLILVVMMQRPKQEGLGAAFGGDAMDSLAGAGATDFLQKGTALLGTLLFVLTFLLSILVISDASGKSKTLTNESTKPPKIEATSEATADALDDLKNRDIDSEDKEDMKADSDDTTPETSTGTTSEEVTPQPSEGSTEAPEADTSAIE